MQSFENREEIARQTGVKIVGLYGALPEHLEISIVEADNAAQVGFFIAQLIPTEQAEIRVSPPTPVEQVEEMTRQMMG